MKSFASLAVVLTLVLQPAIPAQADQPLYGDMDLEFNLGWPGPNTTVPVWIGTVMIDGSQYGMVFFNVGSGKPFVDRVQGNVAFFGEIWVIYDWITFNFDTQEFLHGEVLLWGVDEGVTTRANSKYRMNGSVEGAFGIFEQWDGRNVHMSGTIEFYPFGAPHFAPGVFRIN